MNTTEIIFPEDDRQNCRKLKAYFERHHLCFEETKMGTTVIIVVKPGNKNKKIMTHPDLLQSCCGST